MAASTTRILVVGPDARFAQPMADRVRRLPLPRIDVAVATAGAAALQQVAAGVDVVLLAACLAPAELAALAQAADDHAAVPLLWTQDSKTLAAAETALALGCRGMVTTATDDGELVARLVAAAGLARSMARRNDEWARMKSQCEQLRKQCALTADRFQDSQESYYLDLSRMMTIITAIMDGIVFTDRDGCVTLLNAAAEDLLGLRSFVALGKPLSVLQARTELLTALVADHGRIADAADGEIVRTVELHHAEQDLLYIKCITSRVRDYRGQAAGVLSVLKDVTAEYKSDQLKNQYLSIVAHELRTPLTGIKTFSSMMAKGMLGTLSERQQQATESIREQTLRLEHQIDKLINLGHLESDDYGQDRGVLAVSDLAAGLLAPFEQPARDRRIELAFRVEAADRQMLADRADLRRACQALVENAIKFTPDGGRVEVEIGPGPGPEGSVRFSVRDNGIGIDPRYHRRIFEKFFQVEDPLTRHHGGAGLGLFVAQGIVVAHGGRIEVSSQLGLGAEFSFVLPLHRGEQHAGVRDGAPLPMHHGER